MQEQTSLESSNWAHGFYIAGSSGCVILRLGSKGQSCQVLLQSSCTKCIVIREGDIHSSQLVASASTDVTTLYYYYYFFKVPFYIIIYLFILALVVVVFNTLMCRKPEGKTKG